MSKEDDYRRNAAETVDLAHRASTTADKGRLLALAEGWLNLADRAHRTAREHVGKLRELALARRSGSTDKAAEQDQV